MAGWVLSEKCLMTIIYQWVGITDAYIWELWVSFGVAICNWMHIASNRRMGAKQHRHKNNCSNVIVNSRSNVTLLFSCILLKSMTQTGDWDGWIWQTVVDTATEGRPFSYAGVCLCKICVQSMCAKNKYDLKKWGMIICS